ncbi:hypothetical protein BGX33_010964 [Mortierella sp. NVP41]|nr:hypothetical protein BGX33_010964 [Mortierella sp. NVP41]
MTLHQIFRHGAVTKPLEVRKDKTTGKLYSRITDIQRVFPGASLFTVDGVFLNFLEDENEQDCPLEPSRRRYSISRRYRQGQRPHRPYRADHLWGFKPPEHGPVGIKSLSAAHPASSLPSSSLSSSDLVAYQTASIARPVAMLSSIASDIAQLQHQINHSTDQQSAHHRQLLERLIQMVEQQNKLVEQQNEMLREQAASKDREEQMLREQAESKERQEKMLRMQQETIDRLIVNQQRVEALLVQNYELHEYPIPRLFVVLPDSFKNWDPRNYLIERFRLYFLCECGPECGPDSNHGASSSPLSTTATAPTVQIPVKNRIHLAKHDGYEPSRPKEFLESYGPYVLGMLRVLKHCLAVAAVVSPVVGLAHEGVKGITEGVKSISECTMEAVDMSINFLEQKLDDTMGPENFATCGNHAEEDDLFENLAALKGADLRRLDTFLRNNDQDKVLGDLYRITTESGHAKWVCFEHYKETYCQTALDSFAQSVETAGGVFDPHFRKVTINLTSSIFAKDFFKRLAKQAPAIDELDVSLDWKFGSSDLVMLVNMLDHSNVRTLHLDLKDFEVVNTTIASLRPGKGRYHSLLSLLSNTKLRGLCFSNLLLLATRTSDLPLSQSPSLLQSFHFQQKIVSEDNSRLTNILQHCPGLVDLRLGSYYDKSRLDLPLHHAICSSKKLQVLHLYRFGTSASVGETNDLGVPVSMKDIFITGDDYFVSYVHQAIRHVIASLEVLVLRIDDRSDYFDATPILLSDSTILLSRKGSIELQPSADSPLSKLSHLDLPYNMTNNSIELLVNVLPQLQLIHLGTGGHTKTLLPHVNFTTLKSLTVCFSNQADLQNISDAFERNSQNCQIDSMIIKHDSIEDLVFPDFLSNLPLRVLFLSGFEKDVLHKALETVNLSTLQVLSICWGCYDWSKEAILAARSDEFTESLVIELVSNRHSGSTSDEGSRETQGTLTKLARSRVRCLDYNSNEQNLRYVQSALPKHTY